MAKTQTPTSDLAPKKLKFSVAINSPHLQKSINNTLRDPERAKRFTAAIVSAVSLNPDLNECEASTVVTAALLGESLNLAHSPQLGRYYLVPFNDNNRKCKVAQFQLGYKGYIELALRSGYYKKINVISIKQGELVKYDPLFEEIEVNLIEDEDVRESAPTIGYYAMFEYVNGFRKAMYWSKSKMERHANKYSPGYRVRKGFTFWEKDFDGMAYKTMLRQLISKWGVMSIEMQNAYTKDMSVMYDDGSSQYIETDDDIPTIQDDPSDNAPQTPAGTVTLDEI